MSVLILAPHMDDEVLGCSSWLKKSNVTVLYTSTKHPLTTAILEENKALVELAGFRPIWTPFDKINELDRIPQRILINEFESAVRSIKPGTVIVPYPGCSQDHRACYEAMLTACRPHDRNFYVKRVLVYEQPATISSMRNVAQFKPTYFRRVDIDWKVQAYNTYTSQVRPHRCEQFVKALAFLRGSQSNMEYAEAFEVLRWVE